MAIDTGHKFCQTCGAKLIPMLGGKGWRCSKSVMKGGKWIGCPIEWNNNRSKFTRPQQQVIRPTTFPTIANPTAEQVALKLHLGQSPAQRGGRCTVTDAGPGTAKTTSLSWSMGAVHNRLRSLIGYGMRAFNVNASRLLQSKLPEEVCDINTLHSAGKQAQGHKGMANLYKINTAFRNLTSHLDPKERPGIGQLKVVLERSRNLCLWTTADDIQGWNEIIATVLARFPSIAKKCVGREEHLTEYLPSLAAATLADGKNLDFSDMITRPVMLAMQASGFRMPCELVLKSASQWTNQDVAKFAELVKAIRLPNASLVVDEAQDLDLAQIAVVLAQTWRNGELTLVGDDRCGEPGQEGWKAGQAIYGWRGAFSGSLTLIERLWKELTGENIVRKPLTETFRHGEEICNAYRPLNSVIHSNLPKGYSAAYSCEQEQAFSAWLALSKEQSGLWITRTNAAMVPVLLNTIRNGQDCTIRGGQDFASAIETALYEAAGAPNKDGEYMTPLSSALDELKKIVNESQGEGGEKDPNNLETFMLEIGLAIYNDPGLLEKANLPRTRTVGNLYRFVMFFADRNSRRVITNVYRCKGDEADLAVVADVEKFNLSWGNSHEDDACRHVALSRAKRLLLTVGIVAGSSVPPAPQTPLLIA